MKNKIRIADRFGNTFLERVLKRKSLNRKDPSTGSGQAPKNAKKDKGAEERLLHVEDLYRSSVSAIADTVRYKIKQLRENMIGNDFELVIRRKINRF